ncbi:SDR family oxidoreductase [Halomarina halobia]|uniref:SDR family oxidoreductase n=1 Tax=Halomarina halobia TaxID=3033386 RepID=A0ABD6AFI0_9EURY|nr:SDR family oxidoreductase [Halomarina sp. PSR21]
MDLGLKGATAIVTASSKGLGRAVATELVREGATVVISSRSDENLTEAKDAIIDATDASSDAIIPVVCDLSNVTEIREQMAMAIERLGGLDVLVANHGGPPAQGFDASSLADFDNAYDSVLRSTVAIVDATLPSLVDDGGSITTVVSASAREPPADHILSNTFRSGLYGFSKGLAKEYADQDVRVNCVCPRGVLTDRIEYKIRVLADREDITVEEARQRREAELPLGRLGDPEEFARAVAFMASNAASFTTGSVFQVDGGWADRIL